MRAAAASLLVCACSLARLPDASFPCSVDADCLTGRCVAGTCRGALPDSGAGDAGPNDAGTPDAGTPDAGTPDAGTPDAGAPDAGSADAGAADAGPVDAGPLFCDTWACAASGFTPWDGGITFDSLPCAHFDGGFQLWFGAVLAPSGNVVGIPKEARYPLRVFPKSRECEIFGDALAADAGTWSSGVLGKDGLVYAAPYTAHRMLRIDEAVDGGAPAAQEWGPDLWFGGFAPLFIGAALDREGSVWMVSSAGYGVARVPADAGSVAWYGAPWGLWGLARIEPGPDALLVSAPSGGGGPITIVDPRAGAVLPAAAAQPPLFGAWSRLDGSLWSVGLNVDVVARLSVAPDAGATVELLDAGSLHIGFATTGPDGEIWAMPRNYDYVVRLDEKRPIPYTVPFARSGYSSCGVVATPHGIIGLPCEGNDSVTRLRLSSGEHRTMQQLLSPFFNRL